MLARARRAVQVHAEAGTLRPGRDSDRMAGMRIGSLLSSARRASSWRWKHRNRISDPIVDEVRRVRAELAARDGNDVAAIIRHAQEMAARRIAPACAIRLVKWLRRATVARHCQDRYRPRREQKGTPDPPYPDVIVAGRTCTRAESSVWREES